MKLFLEAVLKFSLGVILVGLLLFVPAGTVHWTNGWLYMALQFIPMFVAGIIMIFTNPDLLRSRLKAKENRSRQSLVIRLSGLMYVAGYILAGLNYRYCWLVLPHWVTIMATVVFVIAYLLYGEVVRENTYLSRTIQVQKDQTVVDTGLYGIVRHPMYAVTLLLFLSVPLMLGSMISFLIFLVYPLIIRMRILDEEKVLNRELKGYPEYCRKVRYRLIPGLW